MLRNVFRRIAAGLLVSAVVGAVASAPARADGGTDVEARKLAGAADVAAHAHATGRAARATPAPHGAPAPATGDSVTLTVGFKPDVAAGVADGRLRSAGLTARGNASLSRIGVRTVTVPRASSAQVTAELEADPQVSYVEPADLVRVDDVTPNDPYYQYQTELAQITVPAAWTVTTGSAVTVAVIDTGVSPLGDIAGAVLPGYDFVNKDADPADDHGHGTAVASVIAARANDGDGMAGVCWSCQILPVKVMNADGSGFTSDIAAGIVYAADHGAKIINLSLGGYSDTVVERTAVTYAQGKGALVIASAGNDAVKDLHYPSAYPGVVGVGGTDTDSDWFFAFDPWLGFYGSNYGPDHVDVAAPWCTVAIDIDGFDEDPIFDKYQDFCGTSASSPLVTGVVALLKSRQPGASNAALTYALTSTARPTVTTGFTQFGEIRAAAALGKIDVTTPKVTGSTPARGKRFRGTVTVTATGVSDTGSGVAYAALYANGKYIGKDTTAPYAVKYASGKSNGTVALQWRVFDKAGNSANFNHTLIADNKAPTVKITSGPKNGAKVKGTVTVKASAGDASGIARVELLVNGKVVTKDASAPYTFKIKTATYGKKIKIQVRSVDKVGNTAITATRTWKR